ncbi:hypothetical protein A5695_19430 [Mycobacterium sp. E1747]|nr:hypothetical protein [Mycobacterium sp. E1747]OBH11443.1 hypothetical protein A5695_19430 [Mycobacterium sp. E1747]
MTTLDYPVWLRVDPWLNVLFVTLIIGSGIGILSAHHKVVLTRRQQTGQRMGVLHRKRSCSATTPWLTGAAALLTRIAVHDIVARLRFIPWVHRLVDPLVWVLVRGGQLDERNLLRCGLTHDDMARSYASMVTRQRPT